MQTVTRRHFLRNTAAAGAVGTAAAAPVAVAAVAAPMGQGTVAAPTENPKLLAAHEAVLAADAELQAAKDALEWLVDEYRHLWPLAPEEILGAANASPYLRGDAVLETDLAGRPLPRETAPLTKRLSNRFRQTNEKTCFHLDTAIDLQERFNSFRALKPTGRTPRALARNRAWIQEARRKVETALQLAIQYEAETARLRNVSGVEGVKMHVATAIQKRDSAVAALCKQTAFTTAGVALKAEAVKMLLPSLFSKFGEGTDAFDALINALTRVAVPQV
ncbi:MAG: hypothetical protein KL840_21910 [Aquamicrobium sp.]|nr:hypothetical protein [Aquamicrobium sp.]